MAAARIKTTPVQHDSKPRRRQPQPVCIRQLMQQMHQRGHEIGLHPSYGTYQRPELIKQEADRPGFRCGTCHEYPAFNPVTQQPQDCYTLLWHNSHFSTKEDTKMYVNIIEQ